MKVFCLKQFKTEVEKLRRKNSYASIEADILDHFIGKTIAEVQNGVRLNGPNSINPYIKKRLDGRGGYRVYFLLVVINDAVYLMHIHPKTGPYGSENIADELKKNLYKDVIETLENTTDLWEIEADATKNRIVFTPVTSKNRD